MAIWDNFFSWFKGNVLKLDAIIEKLAAEVYFKNLAVQACVNLIANTLTRAEFRTYVEGKEIRGDMYYLFNVEPNPNKNASKFWRDVISKLVYQNECLVVMESDRLYVADSFQVVPGTFVENLYTNIQIGELTLQKKYREPDVLHFELHDEKISSVIEGLYNSYGKLIDAAQKHYKRNGSRRGALEIPASYPQTDKAQKDLQDLLNNRFKKFFEAEGGAVIPLTNDIKYIELDKGTQTKGSIEGRDIRAFIDDVFDFVAIAFQIPPQLLKGDVADTRQAVNNLLTFCINPLAELLSDEINRKMYGKTAFLERTYMRIDTSHIRAVDIKDIAGALDILVRIGAYSVDDCLKHLGMEPLNTEWSRARWMTKNYEPIEEALKGGGAD